MKILMLLEAEFPPDIRVENEIKTLTTAGHEIHLACTTKGTRPDVDQYCGATVYRKLISNFIYKSSVGALKLPFYFNFWRGYLNGLFRNTSYDAIHIHDLPLTRIGAEIKLRYKIPLIIDLHENWPGLLSISPHTKTALGKLLCNIKQWEDYEKKYLRYADKIIVVVQEAKERIINLSIPEHKISIVSNTINIRDLVSQSETHKKISGKKIFLYEGGITYHRGIQYFLKALTKIKSSHTEIEFWIIGTGSYLKDLKYLSHQMDLDHIVRFFGQQPQQKVFDLINTADIAIIPHIKSPHTDTTVPHKLFHYMYAGLPILASNCDPVERIIQETTCGYVYTYNNIDELASKLEMILSGELPLKSTDGKKWIMKKYNWAKDEIILQKIYRELNHH